MNTNSWLLNFQVILSHRLPKPVSSELPSNMRQVAVATAATEDGFILSDGSSVKAEIILYCTGEGYSWNPSVSSDTPCIFFFHTVIFKNRLRRKLANNTLSLDYLLPRTAIHLRKCPSLLRVRVHLPVLGRGVRSARRRQPGEAPLQAHD